MSALHKQRRVATRAGVYRVFSPLPLLSIYLSPVLRGALIRIARERET